jgi:hypothetical protein
VGFWPGSGDVTEAAYYAYAAPEPPGFGTSLVQPEGAFYNPGTKGFILRYDDVRRARAPERKILAFCQSTYDAAALAGGWDPALERRRFAATRRAA